MRPAGTIVGPRRDRARIPGIDIEVDDGDRYRFGEAEAEVYFAPGHTSGHIAYAFREQKALFCGDTLFALGLRQDVGSNPVAAFAEVRHRKDVFR